MDSARSPSRSAMRTGICIQWVMEKKCDGMRYETVVEKESSRG